MYNKHMGLNYKSIRIKNIKFYKHKPLNNQMAEIKYADKGDKIKVEKCPHCKGKLVVRLDKDQTEVLICDNCKFEVKK